VTFNVFSSVFRIRSYIAERDIAQLIKRQAVSPVVLGSCPGVRQKVVSLVGRQEGHPVRKIISQALNKIPCNGGNVLPVHVHGKYDVKHDFLF
jgi:hypothetical protein